MNKKISFLMILFFSLMFVKSTFAWHTKPEDKGTHQLLSKHAANNSVLRSCINDQYKSCGFLKKIDLMFGLKEKLTWNQKENIEFWLSQGAEKEDAGSLVDQVSGSGRFYNHFHNPLLPWIDAGLDDIYSGQSSLVWAQDWESQLSSPEGDWTWSRAREEYYFALTAPDDLNRQEHFAMTFRALGHQLHLLQDKAVPEHVRNDAHPWKYITLLNTIDGFFFRVPTIETWVTQNPAIHSCLFGDHALLGAATLAQCATFNISSPVNIADYYPDLVALTAEPTSSDPEYIAKLLNSTALLFDANQYNPDQGSKPSTSFSQGLSEYTNGNFVSPDTIFAEQKNENDPHYFPYPAKGSTNLADYENQNIYPETISDLDGREDIGLWLRKTGDGESLSHFVKPTYFTTHLPLAPDVYVRTFYIDEICYRDYSKKLLPRAVGYSTALIDYFFRGRLDVQSPVFIPGEDGSLSGIRNLQVQNLSTLDNGQTIEAVGSGSLELVYYYTPDGAAEPVYHHVSTPVYTSSEDDPMNNGYVTIDPIIFDEGESIPSGIAPEDVTMMLVFSGTLGNEDNAVAAQIFAGSVNSRIAYFSQPDGPPNSSNIYSVSPDGSYPYQVTNIAQNPWHFSPVWSADGTMMAFEKEYCTETGHDPAIDPTCPDEFYFRDISIVDLLSEQQYPNNVKDTLHYVDGRIANPAFSPDGTMLSVLVQSQESNPDYGSIVVFNLETHEEQLITIEDDPHLSDFYGSAPASSPAGDKIAYCLNQQYDETSGKMEVERDIFTINPDGSGKNRLTNDDYNNIQPAWSPDGEMLVFSSNRAEAGLDIWLMDKDGGNMRMLADCEEANCYSPTFSPDGNTVAFTNTSSIFTINIGDDPASRQEIAPPGYRIGSISWSPFLIPPTMVVQVDSRNLMDGESTTISWESSGATDVFISGVAGKQPTVGSMDVSPESTTTYTLTAIGLTGNIERRFTIIVEP